MTKLAETIDHGLRALTEPNRLPLTAALELANLLHFVASHHKAPDRTAADGITSAAALRAAAAHLRAGDLAEAYSAVRVAYDHYPRTFMTDRGDRRD